MTFNYQKSARMWAFRKIIFPLPLLGSILMVALSLGFIKRVYENGFEWGTLIFGPITLLMTVTFLTSLFSMLTLIKKAITYGGLWEIKITDSEIIWNAPEFAEESFRISFDDIYKLSIIETGLGEDYKISYSIESINGNVIKLSSLSGVSLKMFMASIFDLAAKHDLDMECEHLKEYAPLRFRKA